MGKRFNAPNDLVLDAKGRIYFSDPRYLGTETRELEHRAVYRIDTDGTVVEVTHDVEKPNGVALSPDEKRLLSGSRDKTLRLWDVDSGQEIRRFNGHSAWVRGVAFAPDGKRIASSSWDRTIRLWDVDTGKTV